MFFFLRICFQCFEYQFYRFAILIGECMLTCQIFRTFIEFGTLDDEHLSAPWPHLEAAECTRVVRLATTWRSRFMRCATTCKLVVLLFFLSSLLRHFENLLSLPYIQLDILVNSCRVSSYLFNRRMQFLAKSFQINWSTRRFVSLNECIYSSNFSSI